MQVKAFATEIDLGMAMACGVGSVVVKVSFIGEF